MIPSVGRAGTTAIEQYRLQAAGTARIICLTCSAHRRSDINYDDPRHDGDALAANAVMPGAIRTGLQRHLRDHDLAPRGWSTADTTSDAAGWKTPEQGAATSIWAAVAPELERRQRK